VSLNYRLECNEEEDQDVGSGSDRDRHVVAHEAVVGVTVEEVVAPRTPPRHRGHATLHLRKADIRLPGKGNPNSQGARPVHKIISKIKWIRTSRSSIKISPSAPPVYRGQVTLQLRRVEHPIRPHEKSWSDSVIKWIRASRLSMKNPLSLGSRSSRAPPRHRGHATRHLTTPCYKSQLAMRAIAVSRKFIRQHSRRKLW
jgi:hypothetical protein